MSDDLDDADLNRYARQLILKGMDEAGQQKILKSKLLVVGAGGLGAPLLLYLAAAGCGHITIIDGDQIEPSNLNRQICFSDGDIGTDGGKPKASTAAAMAQKLNPRITINAIDAWLDEENAPSLIKKNTIIADASDRPEMRDLINRLCHKNGKVMVFGGASRLEGQIATFRSGLDADAPCFACLFPDLTATSQLPRCSETGILGAITGIIGTAMALEILKQCLLPEKTFGENLTSKLMLYDGTDNFMRVIRIKKRRDCAVCGIKS